MAEHVMSIQHGHWNTDIERLCGDKWKYRITTSSPRSNLRPQSFADTLPQAKKHAGEHITQVSE